MSNRAEIRTRSRFDGCPPHLQYLIINEGARVLTKLYLIFLDTQGQLIPQSMVILPKVELIQALRVVLMTCKNEEDPIKIEGFRMLKRFFLIFKRSMTANSAVCCHIGPKIDSSEILWLSSLPATKGPMVL